MKHWMKPAAVMLAAALLLTACGSQEKKNPAGQSAKAVTLAEILEVNEPAKVLESYGVIAVKQTVIDTDGTEIYTENLQYTKDSLGHIEMYSKMDYAADEGMDESISYSVSKVLNETSGAYYSENSGMNFMTCIPSWEYDEAIRTLLPPFETSDGLSDEELSCEARGSELVLTVKTTLEGTDSYYTAAYHVDAKSRLLNEIEVLNYESADAEPTTLRYEWAYDRADKPEKDLARQAAEGDTCDLTLVINPGQEQTETQRYQVNHDMQVNVFSKNGCTLYRDEDLTEQIEDYVIDVTGSSNTVYVVLGA